MKDEYKESFNRIGQKNKRMTEELFVQIEEQLNFEKSARKFPNLTYKKLISNSNNLRFYDF